jgi:alkaline phosphatase
VVSLLDDGTRPTTLLEAAAARGMATGVITTSGLVDATPAAFTSHAESRYAYGEILEQMVGSHFDILIGGDWSRSARAMADEHYRKLVDGLEEVAAERWTVVRDEAALAAAEPPLIALLPPRSGNPAAHGPELAITVARALELLTRDPEGFVLIVENEDTDEAAHGNRIDDVVAGVRELDTTARLVLELAEERGDILVLVTADHDTGGLGVVDGAYDEGVARVRWATNGHTAQWVPLLAAGPRSEVFGGILDNSEVGRRIAHLLGFEEFPNAAVH